MIKSKYTELKIEQMLRYDNIIEDDTAGEKGLWRSVVIQAIIDISHPPNDKISKIERAKTITWFSMQNRDFLFVCSLARLNPKAIIKVAKTIIKNNNFLRYKKRKKNYRHTQKPFALPSNLPSKLIEFL